VVRDWYPALDGVVWSIACYEGTVYIGGSFERVGNWPQASLAVVSGVDDHPRPIVRSLAFSCSPNPTPGSALIRYSLPQAARVTLSVFDVQGRRIGRVLDRAPQAAGAHVSPIDAGSWGQGCFFYRLEAGDLAATRKVIVVK
jgi:hypothetical protein